MRPETTFLTSSELQRVIGNELDEDGMEELQAFRDRVLDRFREHIEALNAMEEVYGEEWRALDIRLWVFDGQQDSISSPILLQRGDEDAVLFEAFQMLAKQLIRDRPPRSDLVDRGYDRIDAFSALLAKAALEQVMDDDALDTVLAAARDVAETKHWRAVERLEEEWGGETALRDWAESR